MKVAAVAIIVMLSAAPSSLGAQRVVTRDSIGVRIVTSPPRSKLPVAFRVGPQLWDVGGLNDDPARELGKDGGRHAVVLSNGTIVVSEQTRIVYFDARGKFVGSVGRKGGGPGEFELVGAMCVRKGDTLQVNDGGMHRTTIIGPDRAIARIVPGRRAAELTGCTDAAWTITTEIFPKGDGWTQWVHVRGVNDDGVPRVDFGDFPLRGMGVTIRTGALAAHGSRVALGSGIEPSIDVHDTTGRLVQRLRLDEKAAPITAAERKSGVGMMQGVNGKTGASMKLSTPTGGAMTWPAYGELRYDPLGRLWMEDYTKQISTGWWTVFAASGEALGRMQLPKLANGRLPLVVGFARDAILIRREDDDGAPHVTAYRLIPNR